MYEKVSYWLTNYNQQECDELKKRFGNRHPNFKAGLGYKQNIKC